MIREAMREADKEEIRVLQVPKSLLNCTISTSSISLFDLQLIEGTSEAKKVMKIYNKSVISV